MGEYKFIRDMCMELLEAVYGKDEKKNEKIGSKGNFISWFKNLFKKR